MYKVMIVGDGFVGKTCMLNRYAFGEPPYGYEPTVFENYSTEITVEGKPHSVELWDTAGQEDYDRLRNLLYTQADAFVVCYAIDDSNSFRHVRYKYIPELRKVKPKCPIVIAGTKSDLRATEENEGKLLRRELGEVLRKKTKAHAYIETSAVSNTGINETFDEVVRALVIAEKTKRCAIL